MLTQKKLSSLQRFFYLDGKTSFNVCLGMRVRMNLSSDDLQNALRKIQQKHSLLKAFVKDEKAPSFFISDTIPNIPIRKVTWQNNRTWEDEVRKELNIPFDMESGPLIRFLWITNGAISDLIFVSHHCIGDALSLTIVMSELLRLLDDKNTEIGNYEIYNDITDFVEEQPSSMKLKGSFFNLMIRSISLLSRIKNSNKKENKVVTDFLMWTLSPEQTRTVVAASKKANVTVYIVLLIAFARAYYKVLGTEGQPLQKSINTINTRRHLSNIQPDVFDNVICNVDIAIDGRKELDFWTIAKKISNELKDKTTKENIHSILYLYGNFIPTKQGINISKYNEGKNSFEISNLGRLDIPAAYKNLKIEKSLGFLASQPWRYSKVLFISTFKEEMTFYFTWNKEVFDHEQMQTMRDIAMQELEKACV